MPRLVSSTNIASHRRDLRRSGVGQPCESSVNRIESSVRQLRYALREHPLMSSPLVLRLLKQLEAVFSKSLRLALTLLHHKLQRTTFRPTWLCLFAGCINPSLSTEAQALHWVLLEPLDSARAQVNPWPGTWPPSYASPAEGYCAGGDSGLFMLALKFRCPPHLFSHSFVTAAIAFRYYHIRL